MLLKSVNPWIIFYKVIKSVCKSLISSDSVLQIFSLLVFYDISFKPCNRLVKWRWTLSIASIKYIKFG